MTEPITLTVSAIVGVIFTKAIEKITEKSTESTLEKLNQLKNKIIEKLTGKPTAKKEIEKINQGKEPNLEILADYLKIEMREDQKFSEEIKKLVQDINSELETEGEQANIMYVYGGKAYQQNQNQGEIYNADSINIYQKD